MKLSIIVPIYNVAPYLRKCVDSLLAQDIADYEIILVDDGSTDGSSDIAEEILQEAIGLQGNKAKGAENSGADDHASTPYTIHHTPDRQSPLIKVIHQPNAGLSAARNTGIAAAQGEYIMFVDSDDYLEPNVLGALMEQVKREQLDVLRFDYQNVRQTEAGEYEVFLPNKYPHQVDTCREVVDGETYLDERMGYACYACQFVINRELTGWFTPGIHYEDTEWLPRMMLAAKRVNSTPIVVYNYLVRQGSITLSQKDIAKQRKQLNDKLNILTKLNKLGNTVSDRRWFDSMISGMLVNIVGIIASNFYSERKEYIRLIKALDILPIATYHIAPRAQRKVRLINMSLRLALVVLHWR